MKWTLLMIAAFSATFFVSGCGSGDSAPSTKTEGSPTAASSKKLRIAVIPKGSTHEFWKSVHEGADKAGAELGVEIIWKGPLKEDDKNDQVKVVEDFTVQKVDGIVLAPLDNSALRNPVVAAQKEGIPVVIFDSGLKGVDYVSFVATDNYQGGATAGEELSKALGDKGKIVVLRYAEGSASTMEREKGFLDTIAKHPGIQVLSSNQFAGATVESAMKSSENLLSQYKSGDGLSIDGIFTPNESSTFGMLKVLRDNKWAGKVKFFGFDASKSLLEAVKSGELEGVVAQNPRMMGYTAVKNLVAHIKKEKVEKEVKTSAAVITKANMDQPDKQDFVKAPKE